MTSKLAFQWLPCQAVKVKVSASRAEDPRFDSHLCSGDFSRLTHTNDFKIGIPVATLPGAWRCRVSSGTGWPGFCML